ncbi:MAG: PEGA domain-containing protein, partial [Rhodothermales bacterium]|nr:PEGA domain-containing protein [Rhodothermales bacterium]
PGLPPALDGVLARALARAPEDRFANAAAMRAAFAAVPAEQAAPVPGERTALLQRTDAPPPPADAPPRRRSRLLYGAAAVAATAVLALAGVWLLPISTAPEDGTLQPPLAAADSGAADPARPRDDFVPAGSQPPVQEAEGTPAANEEIDDPAPTEAAGTGTDDPAEPTPVATGTLLLHVAPGGGSIRIDGAPECRSDAPCAVPAGQRSVTFSHPRYGDHQTRLRVTAGGTTERTFQFEQSVNVQAVGGFASVWIRPAGGTWRTQPDWFTPKTLTLGPGTWEIEVRKQGDEVGGGPRTVVVEPGFDLGPQRVVFQLQPP